MAKKKKWVKLSKPKEIAQQIDRLKAIEKQMKRNMEVLREDQQALRKEIRRLGHLLKKK